MILKMFRCLHYQNWCKKIKYLVDQLEMYRQ